MQSHHAVESIHEFSRVNSQNHELPYIRLSRITQCLLHTRPARGPGASERAPTKAAPPPPTHRRSLRNA
eukprot:COSAG03_NODE_929_length_5276_cov_15.813599_2_plen_69_part_00